MPAYHLFAAYLWASPEGRAAAVILAGSIILFTGSLWTLIHARLAYADDIFDLEQGMQPYRTYAFSPSGSVAVYDGGIAVMRNGTRVSPMLSHIKSVTGAGTSGDRILRVSYFEGEAFRTIDIRCGAVEDSKFKKLKDMVEQYGAAWDRKG